MARPGAPTVYSMLTLDAIISSKSAMLSSRVTMLSLGVIFFLPNSMAEQVIEHTNAARMTM